LAAGSPPAALGRRPVDHRLLRLAAGVSRWPRARHPLPLSRHINSLTLVATKTDQRSMVVLSPMSCPEPASPDLRAGRGGFRCPPCRPRCPSGPASRAQGHRRRSRTRAVSRSALILELGRRSYSPARGMSLFAEPGARSSGMASRISVTTFRQEIRSLHPLRNQPAFLGW
jgi:hypothetical protein